MGPISNLKNSIQGEEDFNIKDQYQMRDGHFEIKGQLFLHPDW